MCSMRKIFRASCARDTSPTRRRGKPQGTLAGASGWYVGPADVGVCASGEPG